jgi:hypothetical protein
MRRAILLAAAFVAIAFLTGGHCGNEITSPMVTPTPAQTASLYGFVLLDNGSGVSGLPVSVDDETQLTDSAGGYRFDRLPPGHVTVVVQAFSNTLIRCDGVSMPDVLVPGANQLNITLTCHGVPTPFVPGR